MRIHIFHFSCISVPIRIYYDLKFLFFYLLIICETQLCITSYGDNILLQICFFLNVTRLVFSCNSSITLLTLERFSVMKTSIIPYSERKRKPLGTNDKACILTHIWQIQYGYMSQMEDLRQEQ